MKNGIAKTPLVRPTTPYLPVETENQHPLRLAIRRTLRETKQTRIIPLVALSLTGLATPSLAQEAIVELSALDGSNGFVINGVFPLDFSGSSVSTAGDVNGDGVDDLLIGTHNAYDGNNHSGVSYVVFGASGMGASGVVELSALDGNNGFLLLNSFGDVENLGGSVSTAGDVNGTGYVLFGASEVGASGAVKLSELSGSNGFALNGVGSSDASSTLVSAAGDINGDDVDDVLINTFFNTDYGSELHLASGASYVMFGASGVGASGTVELSALDGNNGFVLNWTDDSYSISAVGDINGDGFNDLLINAGSAYPNANYVVFGARGIGSSVHQSYLRSMATTALCSTVRLSLAVDR